MSYVVEQCVHGEWRAVGVPGNRDGALALYVAMSHVDPEFLRVSEIAEPAAPAPSPIAGRVTYLDINFPDCEAGGSLADFIADAADNHERKIVEDFRFDRSRGDNWS